MKRDPAPALFSLGQLVITPNALRSLTPDQISDSLRRHAAGDWGDICPHDSAMNDEAVTIGERLLSSYGRNGRVFWIITEADRSVTTILLPEDY